MQKLNKEWFASVELAVGLPKMPLTRYGVVKKAKREGWKSRKRQGRGGGLEYHISSLPHVTQEYLSGKREKPLGGARAQLFIADHWRNYILMNKFCEDYNDGLLDIQDWVKEAIPSISVTDLVKFVRFYEVYIGPV
ncbi:MAG: hypothetical protein CVV42_21100 [Candidatus Riflebacteria bacterium HGW-Riflebacteria-2]|jgi:hypothetical protein|nr:MAG: hypothetical protein CVV42_21100 [Candidatus Riflebacteria bacterium HGW-Riflebacteria-2]